MDQISFSIVKEKAPYIGLLSGQKKDRLKFEDDHTNRFAIGLFKTAEEGGRNSVKIEALNVYADISSIVNRTGISREDVLRLAKKDDGRALLNEIRKCVKEYEKIKEFINHFFRKEVNLPPQQEIEEIINQIPETTINPKLEQEYLTLLTHKKNIKTSNEINPDVFYFIVNFRLVIGDEKYLLIFNNYFKDFFEGNLSLEDLLKLIEPEILIPNPEIIKIKKDLISKINEKSEMVTVRYLTEVFQRLQSFDGNLDFQNKISKTRENLLKKIKFQVLVSENLRNIKDKDIKKISANLISQAKRSPEDVNRHLDMFFKNLYSLEPKLFSNKVKESGRTIFDKDKNFLKLIKQKINYIENLPFENSYKELNLEIDKNHSYTFNEFIINLSFQVRSLSIYKVNQDFKEEVQGFKEEVDDILINLENLIKKVANIEEFKTIISQLSKVLEKYKQFD